MGSITFSYSTRATKRLPHPVQKRVEKSRKRFQCDMFDFWRQCWRAKCQRAHGCAGADPHGCLQRRQAAMPPDHKDFVRAAFLAKTSGTATVEQALRTVGLAP